jgi:cytochrome c oxidase cbb3-type subunit 4
VSSLEEYFHTDWESMTTNDWIGMILTVVIFVLMVVAYFQVFRPKNREKLESKRFLPFEEDKEDGGEDNGGKKSLPR